MSTKRATATKTSEKCAIDGAVSRVQYTGSTAHGEYTFLGILRQECLNYTGFTTLRKCSLNVTCYKLFNSTYVNGRSFKIFIFLHTWEQLNQKLAKC